MRREDAATASRIALLGGFCGLNVISTSTHHSSVANAGERGSNS